MKRGMTLNFAGMAFLMAVLFSTPALAQDKPAVASGTSSSTPKPKSMWEVGLHAGTMFAGGDINSKFGVAGGVHFRKAIDHLFSIRIDALGGMLSGESFDPDRNYESTWLSGTAFGVLSLNSFRFDRTARKVDYYAMVGGGGNSFETAFEQEDQPRFDTIEYQLAPHMALGAGISFRLGKRFNIGIEHQVISLFGRRSDLLDGFEKEGGVRTPFRDLINYTNLRLNFNIGNASSQSEPLYWVNPLDNVFKDVDAIKKRQDELLADSDGDGVIDAVDEDPNTPPDVPVDTKGRVLDSDKDGIADYKDKEPYYPPRAGETVNSDGVVTNPIGGAGVTEARVKELIDEALDRRGVGAGGAGGTGGGGGVTEMFLPMIHFASESNQVKYSDYGTLAGVARVLKGNPNIRLVVAGHTDQTGPEALNDWLSYQRANSIIEHLVTNHGIGRGRLVLQWEGKKNALVPVTSSYMNRRAEFRVATQGDVEMDPPAKPSGKDGY